MMRQLFLNVALWSIALCLLVRGQDSVLPAPTLVELVVEAGHSSQIKSLWLDKDETRLVSSSDDRIVIWDFKNRRELRAIKDASLAGVAADSSTLMTQSGGAYELWELKSGNKIFSVKDEKECAFQLVGSNLVCRAKDGVFITRDGHSGAVLNTVTSPEKNSLNFAFRYGNRVITGGVENDVEEDPKQAGKVRVWDQDKLALLIENVQSWGASADGKRLIFIDALSELSVLDISSTPKKIFTLTGAKGFSVSPDGRYVSVNNEIWDIDRKVRTYTLSKPENASINIENVGSTSKWFTVERRLEAAHTSEFRRLSDGELRLTVKVDSFNWKFSENERFVVERTAGGDANSILNVYEIETARRLNEAGVLLPFDSKFESVVVSDDGKSLIVDKSDTFGAGRQRDVVSVDLATGIITPIHSAPDVTPKIQMPSTVMMGSASTAGPSGQTFSFSADNKQTDRENVNLRKERNIALASADNHLLYGPMDSRILLIERQQGKIFAQFESRGMSVFVDTNSDKKTVDVSALSDYRKHHNTIDITTGEVVSFSTPATDAHAEEEDSHASTPSWSDKYEAEVGSEYGQDEKDALPVGEFSVTDKASGKEIFRRSNVTKFSFTNDGKYVAISKKDPDNPGLEVVEVMDFATRKVLLSKNKVTDDYFIDRFSPDGKTLFLILVEAGKRQLEVWDFVSKRSLRSYADVSRYEFIDDAKSLVLFKVTDTTNKERPLGTLEVRDSATDSLRFSHDRVSEYEFNEDHSHLLISRPSKSSPANDSVSDVELWNTKDNKLVRKSNGIQARGQNSGFGYGETRKNYVLTETITSGTQETEHATRIEIFDLDGKDLLRSEDDLQAYLVDSDGANLILEYDDRLEWRNVVSENNQIFHFSENFKLQTGLGMEFSVSPNNKYIVFMYIHRDFGENYFAVWDLEKNWAYKRAPHSANVTNVVFSPDERFLISSSDDGSAKWWALEDGLKEVLTFVPVDETNWVATDPSGRFDTSFSLDSVKGIHWNVGTRQESVPLEAYMRQYYSPGLLSSVLRCNSEFEDDGTNTCDKEFKALPSIAELNRVQTKIGSPLISTNNADGTVDVMVAVESITENVSLDADPTKKARLTSGAFDLRLFRDGQLVATSTPKERQEKYITLAPANAAAAKQSDKVMDSPDDRAWRSANNILDIKSENVKQISPTKAEVTFRNIRLPRDGRKEIEFSAYAFNTDRVKSETVRSTLTIEKPEMKKGRAYIVSIGVNASDNRVFDLKYAANDARKMQQVLGSRLASSEFSEVIRIPLISERRSNNNPQSGNARKAIIKGLFSLLAGHKNEVPSDVMSQIPGAAKMAPVAPEDTLIITYAGHGYADRSGIFYLLPQDIGVDTSELTTKNLNRMISSDELSLWMQDVTAAEMIMVIDACHSSSAVQGDGFKPGPMGSRGLGQLAYDKGMKILSATQADNVALELGKLEQGLLSYVLLEDGVMAKKADTGTTPDGKLTSSEWLGYAVQAVPKLYQDVLEGRRSVVVGGKKVDVSKIPTAQRDITIFGAETGNRAAMVQQPSVFDFRRKRDENPMITLK